MLQGRAPMHRRSVSPAERVAATWRVGWALLVAALPASALGQAAAVSGHVADAGTQAAVAGAEVALDGLARSAVTDADGYFLIEGIPGGALTVRVRHIAYGDRSLRITAADTGMTYVRLELTDSALVLAPLEVAVLGAAERQLRSLGYRRNVVTRAQLAQARGTSLTFGEVLRQFVPGVRVRTVEGVVGAATCIELRAAVASRNRCLYPAVYVDGAPVTNVSSIFAAFPLEMIESIEVVPAAEAGGRFGTGALHGALLIESRRAVSRNDAVGRQVAQARFHDWSAEERGHSTLRSFAAAAAGNGAGLAGGLAIATTCIGTRAPSHDRLVSTCDAWTTIGATAAAIAVPAIGGAIGSRLGGRSRDSRGQFFPAAVGATMALVPGYALVLTGQRLESDPLRGIGVATLVVVAPFLSAMADHQFRTLRNGTRE